MRAGDCVDPRHRLFWFWWYGGKTVSLSQIPPNAQKAREILQECQLGLHELRSHPRPSWFVLWAGTLALLHTVGDALKNDADHRIRKAQVKWFRLMNQVNKAAGRGTTRQKQDNTWEPAIYWQFIRKDRNLLLHEALSTVSQSATISIPVTLTGIRQSAARDIPVFPAPQPSPLTYSYTMSSPPYDQRDARDVVEEAIQWWEQQINEIEKDAI
jgi:hypothetical protein